MKERKITVRYGKSGDAGLKALFEEMKRIAKERGGARMEWICLDWNQTSIEFYLSQGAKPLDTCTTYRLKL